MIARRIVPLARSKGAVALAMVWCILAAAAAVADDLRVDNSVYVGDQSQPSSQSTTIFSQGLVYDFLTTPAETIVFDKPGGRFVLLNTSLRTRAELKTNEVAAFTDRIQPLALKSPDPVVKFLAAPKFEEQSNEALGEFTLSSQWLSYRVKYSPEIHQSVVEQYHDFSDWYARLNMLLVPGSRPPFARLVLNAALASRKALPSEVTLSLTSRGQTTTVRSLHHVSRPLTDKDNARVAEASAAMVKFKPVSFEQYRKAFSERGATGK